MSDPNLPKMRAFAMHWMSARRWDMAEPVIRSILAVAPVDSQAHEMLATLLLERGDQPAARVAIAQWVKSEPENGHSRSLMALNELSIGSDTAALHAAKEGVRLLPVSPFARGVLAHTLLDVGDLQGAMSTALEALSLNPNEFNALRVLAWTSLKCGRPDMAERAARSLLMLAPDETFSLSAAGQLLRALGYRGEGMRLLHDMLAREPANPRCHLALGHAYWDRGDFPAARRHFREALKLNPKLEEVRKMLRMGRRTSENQMPKGWKLCHTLTIWDANGHKITLPVSI